MGFDMDPLAFPHFSNRRFPHTLRSKPASKVAEIAAGELKRLQKVDFADRAGQSASNKPISPKMDIFRLLKTGFAVLREFSSFFSLRRCFGRQIWRKSIFDIFHQLQKQQLTTALHVANSRIRGDALRFYVLFAMSAATKKHTNAAREVSACTSLPGR